MPLFDLYPIESTSTVIERKRLEWVVSTQTTSSFQKATPFHNFSINSIKNLLPHQSFTRVSIDSNIGANFTNTEMDDLSSDYDLFVHLPVKKSFKVKGKLKSISKLHIIPLLD